MMVLTCAKYILFCVLMSARPLHYSLNYISLLYHNMLFKKCQKENMVFCKFMFGKSTVLRQFLSISLVI